MISVFVLNFDFPKILVKTCIVLEERGNTPKKMRLCSKILGAMVSCLKVMFNVLFA
jgi:hypothetical protein